MLTELEQQVITVLTDKDLLFHPNNYLELSRPLTLLGIVNYIY